MPLLDVCVCVCTETAFQWESIKRSEDACVWTRVRCRYIYMYVCISMPKRAVSEMFLFLFMTSSVCSLFIFSGFFWLVRSITALDVKYSNTLFVPYIPSNMSPILISLSLYLWYRSLEWIIMYTIWNDITLLDLRDIFTRSSLWGTISCNQFGVFIS